MRKNKNKLLITGIMLILTFMINFKVYAITGNNGSNGSNAGADAGTWQYDSSHGYGIRVTIIDKTTGNRVKNTKSVNFVKNTTWNNKQIYTSKESHSKVHYLQSDDKALNFGKYKYNIVHDSKVPDFTKGNLNDLLKGKNNEYELLEKYVKNTKTGYTCWGSNPNMDQCSDVNNHLVVVEPLTVQGTVDTRYDWLTPYEFAVKMTKNANMVNVFKALSNGLYSKTTYTIGSKSFSKVDKCTSNCESYLKKINLSGVGVFVDPKSKKRYDKIKVDKNWSGGTNACKSEVPITVYYKKSNSWKKVQSFTIKNGEPKTISIFHVDNRKYKVVEHKSSIKVTNCSGYTFDSSGVAESKAFTLSAGGTKTVTFNNKLKPIPVRIKKGKVIVDVYKFKSQFKTLNSITDPEPAQGYFWSRVFGGKRIRKKGKNQDEVAYTSTDNANNIPLYVGIIAEKNGSDDYKYTYGPFTDAERDYLYHTTYIDLKKCRTIGDYVWDSDSWSCYRLCYKTTGERTCYIGKVNENTSDPTNFLGNDEPFHKDFNRLNTGLVVQPNVTVSLISNGQVVQGPIATDSNGRVQFTDVPATVDYNVKIECDGCGKYNTYSRIRRETSAFVTGTTSKGFNLGDKETMSVKFFNNNINSCQIGLDKIKQSSTDLKDQLLDLYEEEKQTNHQDYKKLLNFAVNESDASVKTKIQNGTIGCAAMTTSSITPSKSASCDDNEKHLTYANVNASGSNMLAANFIDDGGYTKAIAENIFDVESSEQAYCFVNYKWNFNIENGQNIIKNNVSLDDVSWLWPAITKNEVGTMTAHVYCIGDIRSNEINTDYIASLFKGINLRYEGKLVQSLKLYKDVEYNRRSVKTNYNDPSDIDSYVDENNSSESDDSSDTLLELLTLLPTNADCGEGKYNSDNACYDNEFSCPAGYTLNTADNKCYKAGMVLDEINASLCGSNKIYSRGVCLIKERQPSCPSGYELREDSKCYDTGETAYNELSGKFYKDFEFSFKIGYKNYLFGDNLTGTATLDSRSDIFATASDSSNGSNRRLGWGVPIPFDSTGGKVDFDYNLNQENNIYRLFNTEHINYSCEFTKNKNRIESLGKVRFTETENPFPGKEGEGRTSGLNWDSCYTALTQRIGKTSDISCYDLYGVNSRRCSNGNSFCLYGDYNCDGDISAAEAASYKEMADGKYYGQSSDGNSNLDFDFTNTNKFFIKLNDFNQDGQLDFKDGILFETWYTKTIAPGSGSTRCEKSKINFKNKNTYCFGQTWGKDNFLSSGCNNYVTKLKNQDRSSSSTKTPLYSLTLSPQDLQNIRQYSINTTDNTKKSYIETGNLDCDENGRCYSNFITSLFSSTNGLTLTGISGNCAKRASSNSGVGSSSGFYCDVDSYYD